MSSPRFLANSKWKSSRAFELRRAAQTRKGFLCDIVNGIEGKEMAGCAPRFSVRTTGSYRLQASYCSGSSRSRSENRDDFQ